MSGSAELDKRLRDPYSVTINARDYYLGAWSDTYMVDGATRECHPDFVAKPIGSSPYGFLVCQRKIDPWSGMAPEATRNRKQYIENSNYVPYRDLETKSGQLYNQTYDLYNNIPASKPRNSFLGGQPLLFEDRRMPYQATLQGSDYYKDCIKFRGIGIEPIDRYPGVYDYEENKYYFSAPPPKYDITQAVQPYDIWEREQIRMGTMNGKELKEFNKKHTYSTLTAPTF